MSGQERRAADRRRRSDRASYSTEPPLVQSRGEEFGPTCQTRSTRPGRRASDVLNPRATQVAMAADRTCTHLDHLGVVQPPAQKGLDQREHLLQHHDNLAKSLE